MPSWGITDMMPQANLFVAYSVIGLQFLAAINLCRKSHHFPAMTAFSLGSLVVVWLALSGYNAAWTVGAWVMIAVNLAVAAECAWLLLAEQDDCRDHLKAVVLAAIAAALIAHVSSNQQSALSVVRLVCHAGCSAACSVALLTMRRFGTLASRLHIAIASFFFFGSMLADMRAPLQITGNYWLIHMALTILQGACWMGWLVLFSGLRGSTHDQVFLPSARANG